jgi:Flp pilus assembly protein TadG
MKTQARSWFMSVSGTYWRSQGGAAAAELALVLVLLVVPVLNVIDLATYVYDAMELNNAAQSAAQTAWAQCAATGKVPATINNGCPGLSAAMATAAQTSSLGSDVTVSSTTEDWCCPGTSNAALVCQGSVSTAPSTCGNNGPPPGDYIFVTVSYSYSPAYASVSLATLLTSPITHTAWMRLS